MGGGSINSDFDTMSKPLNMFNPNINLSLGGLGFVSPIKDISLTKLDGYFLRSCSKYPLSGNHEIVGSPLLVWNVTGNLI